MTPHVTHSGFLIACDFIEIKNTYTALILFIPLMIFRLFSAYSSIVWLCLGNITRLSVTSLTVHTVLDSPMFYAFVDSISLFFWERSFGIYTHKYSVVKYFASSAYRVYWNYISKNKIGWIKNFLLLKSVNSCYEWKFNVFIKFLINVCECPAHES